MGVMKHRTKAVEKQNKTKQTDGDKTETFDDFEFFFMRQFHL